MKSIPLWSVTLPRHTNMLGKSAQTLKRGATERPRINSLDLVIDSPLGPHVYVELESPDDMPTQVIIPFAQTANVVPMPMPQKHAPMPVVEPPVHVPEPVKEPEPPPVDAEVLPPICKNLPEVVKGMNEINSRIIKRESKSPAKRRGRPKKKRG
jgi:hypothetical protein